MLKLGLLFVKFATMKTSNKKTFLNIEKGYNFTCVDSSFSNPFASSHFDDLFTFSKAYNEKLLIVFANIRV